MGMSTEMEENNLDYVFEGTQFPTPPTTLYLALHYDHPGNDGTQSELDASDYDRLQTAQADWTRIAGSEPTYVENTVDIAFPDATTEWGAVEYVSLWDGETTSDRLFFAAGLNEGQYVDVGDNFAIEAGSGLWGVR